MFSRDFLKSRGYVSYHIQGKFYSKKNRVFLVSFRHKSGHLEDLVYKLHHSRKNCLREAEMLFLLKKGEVPVPDIMHVGGKGILMEYLKGPSLLEFLEWQERVHDTQRELIEPALGAIYQLAGWLDIFYRLTKEVTGKNMILGDVNFRNFIIRQHLYGVDFEECRKGNKEEDAGRICAFALTYQPSFTSWKEKLVKNIVSELTEYLELDREMVVHYFKQELEAMSIRRGEKLVCPGIDI